MYVLSGEHDLHPMSAGSLGFDFRFVLSVKCLYV